MKGGKEPAREKAGDGEEKDEGVAHGTRAGPRGGQAGAALRPGALGGTLVRVGRVG